MTWMTPLILTTSSQNTAEMLAAAGSADDSGDRKDGTKTAHVGHQ